MKGHMPDSRLNGPEHALQRRFMKLQLFNGLIVGALVLLGFAPLSRLPEKTIDPAKRLPLSVERVALAPAASPLRLAGAWRLAARDRRFHGLSALAIDGEGFVAVSDLGAAIRFDRPDSANPTVWLDSLRDGPGPGGWKNSRDAESLARDPRGRGWWIGYEQRHSLWLYDAAFRHGRIAIPLSGYGWATNRGAEGLIAEGNGLLALAENGRDAVQVDSQGRKRLNMVAPDDIAEAARAPDGSAWVLLRHKGLGGIGQSIAPLRRERNGYATGPSWPIPKGLFDNFEGMAIENSPSGGLRFWLLTDDGHRIMARTLLVALDLPAQAKRPAETGRSQADRPESP